MPIDQDEIKVIKQLLGLARAKDVNFALALGKKAEDTALLLDRRKEGPVLLRQARKADGVEPAKSCNGTVRVEGKLLIMTCLTDPPAGIRKKLKAFFVSIQMPMKISILTPEGADFETEQEVPAEDAAGPTQGDSDAPAPNADLIARLKKVQKDIGETANPQREKLMVALKTSVGFFKSGEIDKTSGVLDRIEAALRKLSDATIPQAPPPPENDLGKDMLARLKRTAKALEAAIAANPALKDKLLPVFSKAKSALTGGNHAQCSDLLDALDKALASLAANAGRDPKALAADLRNVWDKAKSATDGQLNTLMTKIRALNSPTAKLIGDLGLNAWSGGANTSLMTALLEIESSPPERLAAALANAKTAFGGYRDFLQMHPAVGALDRNTFGVTIDLRKQLGGALTEMENLLKAA